MTSCTCAECLWLARMFPPEPKPEASEPTSEPNPDDNGDPK